MSPVKIESIVNVSSEDPAHPASNLLKSDVSNVKWKCKTPGEKNISVVLRLARPVKITGVDIGNENSAFVEISVGRSSEPEDFKVLLVSSPLMTLQEAKYGENRNGVSMFKEDSLCAEVAAEKWDRVKIVCSQPFVTYAPYGLSFIVLHGTADEPPVGSTVGSLGKFHLKDDDEELGSSLTPGLLFARRNDQPAATPVVKVVSTSAGKPKSPVVAKATKVDPSDCLDNSADSDLPVVPQGKKPRARRTDTKKDDKKVAAVAPSTSRGSPPKKAKAPSIKPFNRSPTKPFNRLFEDVVFVISGFQNPYRSDLRSLALEMGAKYKADWDKSCTHLVCAFMNTPKFQQVHGRGKIVKKEWIEESHAKRRYLPWRRFALDPQDRSQPESDIEVYEETPSVASKKTKPPSDSDSDSEDGEKRQLKRKKPQKVKTNVVRPSASNQQATTSPIPSTSSMSQFAATTISNDITIYDMDTEEEIDVNDSDKHADTVTAEADDQSTDDDTPILNSFFSGATFSILSDIQGELRTKLRRYIIAHGGEVEDHISSEEVEYVISESVRELDKALETRPDVYGARPDWIWQCHDRDKLLPVRLYSL